MSGEKSVREKENDIFEASCSSSPSSQFTITQEYQVGIVNNWSSSVTLESKLNHCSAQFLDANRPIISGYCTDYSSAYYVHGQYCTGRAMNNCHLVIWVCVNAIASLEGSYLFRQFAGGAQPLERGNAIAIVHSIQLHIDFAHHHLPRCSFLALLAPRH